jgi:hypothetical protein
MPLSCLVLTDSAGRRLHLTSLSYHLSSFVRYLLTGAIINL